MWLPWWFLIPMLVLAGWGFHDVLDVALEWWSRRKRTHDPD